MSVRPSVPDIAILGPAPAPLSLLRGRYRYRMLLNARRSAELQNVIRDYYRRQKVRNMWTTLLSVFSGPEDDEHDPLESIESADSDHKSESPQAQLEQKQTLGAIEKEIEKLPPRQREAFLMRYWEEMDIAETAAAMGCSEGSVKTHCSRATHTLAAALAAKGITL